MAIQSRASRLGNATCQPAPVLFSVPDPNRSRAGWGPDPNRSRAGWGPDPNQSRAGWGPDPNQSRAGWGPDPNPWERAGASCGKRSGGGKGRARMATLPEVLTNDQQKGAVIEDCCALIDAEVKDKGGISGLAIKAGYGAVKGVKPGFIKHAVEDLLPDFATALEPIYQEAKKENRPVSDFFVANGTRVAEALLSITDAKAAKSKNGLVKGTYEKLRGTAKKNVEAAVPRLGKMIEKHAG